MRSLTALLLLLLVVFLAACEKTIDPETGSTLRFTAPGTAAKAASWQARWQRCIQFASESTCERRVPGGRPPAPGTTASQPVQEQTPSERENDP
ncbi:MAG: hypothetical protein U1E42_00240 [Rhodospirillales bacterium]